MRILTTLVTELGVKNTDFEIPTLVTNYCEYATELQKNNMCVHNSSQKSGKNSSFHEVETKKDIVIKIQHIRLLKR